MTMCFVGWLCLVCTDHGAIVHDILSGHMTLDRHGRVYKVGETDILYDGIGFNDNEDMEDDLIWQCDAMIWSKENDSPTD